MVRIFVRALKITAELRRPSEIACGRSKHAAPKQGKACKKARRD